MSTSKPEPNPARAIDVRVTAIDLAVDLVDGRTVVVPIAWYPRLLHGSPAERSHWRLMRDGEGIHWPDLDEDISVQGLLAGLPSGESQSSLRRWLLLRTAKVSDQEAPGRDQAPPPIGAADRGGPEEIKVPLIDLRKARIAELCREFHVRRLDLFGSAVRGLFDPARSDLDLLVEFGDLPPGEYAEAYFGLREALEALFGRSIDLVTPNMLANPYLKASIEANREPIYAA